MTWTFGPKDAGITFNGIALGTLAALVIYHLMTVIGKVTGTEVPEDSDARSATVEATSAR